MPTEYVIGVDVENKTGHAVIMQKQGNGLLSPPATIVGYATLEVLRDGTIKARFAQSITLQEGDSIEMVMT